MAVDRERFAVFYHKAAVANDIPQISPTLRDHIRDTIAAKLYLHPELYGNPLRRTLKGLWRLRVGDYRVIYQIQGQTVLIVSIPHQSTVYKKTS
jgi:mRNA interferase RelE/StbE